MKCPLLVIGYLFARDPLMPEHSECIKEQCGWYSGASQSCAVPRIASQLYLTVEVLEELRDAIRKEKQV